MPIYEPGLEELVVRNVEAERLHFTTDLAAAVKTARLVFLAVGTPPADDGSADLTALWTVVDAIAPHLRPDAIVVTKSTVPVGTAAKIAARLKELTGRDCDVASNPEFLKEGAALDDFQKPDRVVVGVRRPEVGDMLHSLYAPFLRTENPFLVMSPESSEMTKYVANALLATKISFINEMANLCERMQADINDVRRGIGHDSRIGFAFLFPGVGYGGSCFPKDVQALHHMARQHGIEPRILDAVHEVNRNRKRCSAKKSNGTSAASAGQDRRHLGPGVQAAHRRYPRCPGAGAHRSAVEARRQAAGSRSRSDGQRPAIYGDKLTYFDLPLDALDGADALAIVTEWGEFRTPDFDDMKARCGSRSSSTAAISTTRGK